MTLAIGFSSRKIRSWIDVVTVCRIRGSPDGMMDDDATRSSMESIRSRLSGRLSNIRRASRASSARLSSTPLAIANNPPLKVLRSILKKHSKDTHTQHTNLNHRQHRHQRSNDDRNSLFFLFNEMDHAVNTPNLELPQKRRVRFNVNVSNNNDSSNRTAPESHPETLANHMYDTSSRAHTPARLSHQRNTLDDMRTDMQETNQGSSNMLQHQHPTPLPPAPAAFTHLQKMTKRGTLDMLSEMMGAVVHDTAATEHRNHPHQQQPLQSTAKLLSTRQVQFQQLSTRR